MANSGDGTGWDVASPANTEDSGDGAMEIRDLRLGVGIRNDKEHVVAAGSSVGGEHKEGSGLAYIDAATEPTQKPDGATALDSDDEGRLYVDTDDKTLWYYSGSAWVQTQIVSAMIPAGEIITADIADANITAAKLEDPLDLSSIVDLTLNDPVITTFVNATHDHTDDASGGTFVHHNYVKLVHEEASGADSDVGETCVADTWNKRILTEDTDADSVCSVTTGVITLDVGTYYCKLYVVGYRCNEQQARLRRTNNTPATLLSGVSSYADQAVTCNFTCLVIGKFVVANADDDIEIQHYIKTKTDGDACYGFPSTTGEVETYAVAEFWKEK